MSIKKSLQNFYLFLKNPRLLKKSKDKKQLIKDFIALFLLDLFFAVALVGLFYILLHFNIIKEYVSIDILKEYGVWGALLIACILAPLIEELIFRWHLRAFYGAIYFSFLSVAGLIVSQVNSAFIQLGILITFIIIAYSIVQFLRRKGRLYSVKIWQKTYPYLFYYTTIIFGLIHLSNFKELTITDPSFILYIASQSFGGLGLGYLRIKYGLVYSMLFHAFFNLAAISLAILFP